MDPTANPRLSGHKLAILIHDPPHEAFLAKLRFTYPDLDVAWHQIPYPAPAIPAEYFAETTILCTFNCLPLSNEEAPKLQLVQLNSSGANHAHGLPAYLNPAVKFCTGNGVHAPQIVEWVFATFFSFSHRIPQYIEHQKACEWNPSYGEEDDIEDTVGLRMGILGYGTIGRQCARAAVGFGMDVIVYTLRERSTPDARKDDSFVVPGTGDPDGLLPSAWYHGRTKEDVNRFLAQGIDILVICLPFTPLTNQMIAGEQLHILAKKRAFISNIGRGQLINQPDLIAALDEGSIRGAALDVTDPEPLPREHPLWKAKNCFISPHISWRSSQRRSRVLQVLETNLARLSRGEELVNTVDKELGF